MDKQTFLNLDNEKIFISFACLKDVVDNIDRFELAVVNSNLEPNCKVAINKILTAVQNCNFYGD